MLLVKQNLNESLDVAKISYEIGKIYWTELYDVENAIRYLVVSYTLYQRFNPAIIGLPNKYLDEIHEAIGKERVLSILSKINKIQ